MLKAKLERFQALNREQRDWVEKIGPERRKAEPAFDYMKDEAYLAREKEITDLEIEIRALKTIEERSKLGDNPGQTRGAGAGGTVELRSELAPYREVAARIARSVGREGYQPNDQDAQEFRDLHEYMMTGIAPARLRTNLITTGTTTGGYGVPTMWASQIIRDLPALESVRRAGATVVPINGNENYTSMAKVNGNFIGEGSSVTATDPTVGRVTLAPELLICRTIGSWAVFNRFVTNLETEIQRAFAMGIAETEGSKFLTGSGTNQPQGLTVGGGSALTTASTTTFTPAELDTLWNALHPIYQGNATWFMTGPTKSIAAGLVDANNNRIMQTNMTGGFNTIQGRPVIVDPLMPAATAGLKPIVVADVANGYLIGEEKGLSMIVDPYTQLGTGETQIAMYKYVDGRVKVAAAVKYMTMHA